MQTTRHRRIISLLVILVYSFIVMLFYSASSWLYLVNQSTDPQTIFTVGREMLNGLVPYRDLLEQKGPILYYINAFGALISPPTTIHGIYILESLVLFLNLILVYKIARLYLQSFWCWICVIIVPVVAYATLYFKGGDLAEEFVMPLILLLVYRILQIDQGQTDNIIFKNNFRLYYLEQGIALGITFWIKYSLVGPWVAFFIIIGFRDLFTKSYKRFFNTVIFATLGAMITTALTLIYFWINHSVNDLFEVYFKINMLCYGKFNSFHSIVHQYLAQVIRFPSLNITNAFLTLICFYLVFTLFIQHEPQGYNFYNLKFTRWLLLAIMVTTYLVTFANGNYYYYYYFIFKSFTGLAIINAIYWITKNIPHPSEHQKFVAVLWTILIVLMSNLTLNTAVQGSILFPKNQSIDYEQRTNTPYETSFAKIINQTKNSTMLNYMSLDLGVYLAAQKPVPSRYFAKLNAKYNKMYEGQYELVKNKKVNFVVIKTEYGYDMSPGNNKYINVLVNNYHLVKQQTTLYEGTPMTNFLYEVNK